MEAPASTKEAALSETSVNSIKKSNKPPRVDPSLALVHIYWKSPFWQNGTSIRTSPFVLHVFNSNQEQSICKNSYREYQGRCFLPLTRQALFEPHWIEELIGKRVRLNLRPVIMENECMEKYHEARVLTHKLRYVELLLKPDPQFTTRCLVEMHENHGNIYMKRKHKNRPLLALNIFVDHDSANFILQGNEFYLSIARPLEMDVHDNIDDPGGRIDVGMYCRELDTDPNIKLRFYASLTSKDIPPQALTHLARAIGE